MGPRRGPRIHRPYSRQRDREPSVTEVLNVLGKEGLRWAAANETAVFGVTRTDKWMPLAQSDAPRCRWCHEDSHDRCEAKVCPACHKKNYNCVCKPKNKRRCPCGVCQAIDRVRKHHDGLWRGRAAMGTLIHAANESYCLGEDFDIEAGIDELLASEESKYSIWKQMDRDDIVEQALGYILGLEKFWDEWQPMVYAAESVVRVPGRYIGQADVGMRARVRGVDTIVDIKSTAKQSNDEGIYLDSWWLQVVGGYAFAEEEVFYDLVEDKKLKSGQRAVEVGTGPWPTPEKCMILHLRGDNEYAAFDLPVDRKVHDVFLSLCDIYQWLKTVPEVPQRIVLEEEEQVA